MSPSNSYPPDDPHQRSMTSVEMGTTCYKFRIPVTVRFNAPGSGLEGELQLDGVTLPIHASGATLEAAWRDWSERFHVLFQTIRGRQSFERTPEQIEAWKQIETLIDISEYMRETPLCLRQVGVVTQADPIPKRVRWDGLEDEEEIDLSRMPPTFAAYQESQRFDAFVRRRRSTFELLEVFMVHPLKPLDQASDRELEDFIKSLPTSHEAPSVSWEELEWD